MSSPRSNKPTNDAPLLHIDSAALRAAVTITVSSIMASMQVMIVKMGMVSTIQISATIKETNKCEPIRILQPTNLVTGNENPGIGKGTV